MTSWASHTQPQTNIDAVGSWTCPPQLAGSVCILICFGYNVFTLKIPSWVFSHSGSRATSLCMGLECAHHGASACASALVPICTDPLLVCPRSGPVHRFRYTLCALPTKTTQPNPKTVQPLARVDRPFRSSLPRGAFSSRYTCCEYRKVAGRRQWVMRSNICKKL